MLNESKQQSESIQTLLDDYKVSTGIAIEQIKNTTKKTVEGSESMLSMAQTMMEYQDSNNQLDKLSSNLFEVRKRTNIINQIVLKTQVLSFNASIEAARAGQHGRGFSIVAVEMSNLAKISGDAATAIEQTMNEVTSQMTLLIKDSNIRVKEGQENTEKILAHFYEISNDIQILTERIETMNKIVNSQNERITGANQATNELVAILKRRRNLVERTGQKKATNIENQIHKNAS